MNSFRTFLLIVGTIHTGINAHLEFNNVKCLPKDPAYLNYEYCFLKSINRTYKYFSFKTHFNELPINNATVSFKLFKRDSRYVFDRFNITVDFCKFLKNRRNAMANLAFSLFVDYSNINHTCPYNHDIFVEKLPVQHVNNIVSRLIPNGRYYINSTLITYNIPRANIVVYFTKS